MGATTQSIKTIDKNKLIIYSFFVFQNITNREIALNESKKPVLFYSSYTSSNNLKSSTLEELYPTDVEHLLSLKKKKY